MNTSSMRRLIPAALCLVLAAPAAIHAQAAPASGSTTMISPAESYTAVLSQIESEIVGAADAMPAEKYDFVPTGAGDFKGVRSFSSQVKHLAASNYEFFHGWGIPGEVDPKMIAALKTKAEIMKALKDSYVYVHAAVNSVTPGNAFVALPGPGEYKMTRASSVAFCLAHSEDHYGQLVEYLRMNGIIPPASRKSSGM